MSEIGKLLSSLSDGVLSGALDESWLPYINRAMTELRELEAAQCALAPDGAYLCGKCGLMSRTTKCENCGHIYERPAGKA